ncbi:MAG: hypothetical protein FGM46_00620 [Ferruginibacter sp.]|nr:hypothetical protein [Ferruginibacter sp.]
MRKLILFKNDAIFVFFLFIMGCLLFTSKTSLANTPSDTTRLGNSSDFFPEDSSLLRSEYLLKNDPVFIENWDNEITFSYDDVNFEDLPEEMLFPLVKNNEAFMLTWYGRVNSTYKKRWGKQHHGLDIHLKTGDPVFSAFDGVVRYAQYNKSGFGNCIVIRHLSGIETVYAHLSKIEVEPNQFVYSGQQIGLGGNTGHSFGPHLHFEARYKGYSFNPEYFIDVNTQQLKSDTLFLTKNDFTAYVNKNDFTRKSKHDNKNDFEEQTAVSQNPEPATTPSIDEYSKNLDTWPDINNDKKDFYEKEEVISNGNNEALEKVNENHTEKATVITKAKKVITKNPSGNIKTTLKNKATVPAKTTMPKPATNQIKTPTNKVVTATKKINSNTSTTTPKNKATVPAKTIMPKPATNQIKTPTNKVVAATKNINSNTSTTTPKNKTTVPAKTTMPKPTTNQIKTPTNKATVTVPKNKNININKTSQQTTLKKGAPVITVSQTKKLNASNQGVKKSGTQSKKNP